MLVATRAPLRSPACAGAPGRGSRLPPIYRETPASSLCPSGLRFSPQTSCELAHWPLPSRCVHRSGDPTVVREDFRTQNLIIVIEGSG